MDNLISASEAARRLDVIPQTMSRWLREGRVRGAMKVANMWLVPESVSFEDIDVPKMGRPLKEETVTEGGNENGESVTERNGSA